MRVIIVLRCYVLLIVLRRHGRDNVQCPQQLLDIQPLQRRNMHDFLSVREFAGQEPANHVARWNREVLRDEPVDLLSGAGPEQLRCDLPCSPTEQLDKRISEFRLKIDRRPYSLRQIHAAHERRRIHVSSSATVPSGKPASEGFT